jgi:hypothetical protein
MGIIRKSLTAAAVAALVLPAGAQAQPGELEWFGSVYAKFLDGDRSVQGALYNDAVEVPGDFGGDQGQGVEFELLFRSQVSKQVEIGGRIKARFNRNFWTNFGGFDRDEEDIRSAQYMKLRGVYAIITPGYDWIDSATIGSNDFGMFDPYTQGKYRYIDRDNASGFLFQGSMFDNSVRWDLARVALPSLFAGPKFTTTDGTQGDPSTEYEAGDAAYVGQVRWSPNSDFNGTALAVYIRDKEIDPAEDRCRGIEDSVLLQECLSNGENTLDGTDEVTRYDNTVLGARAEYSGLGPLDISGGFYWSDYNVDETVCDGDINGNCRFSPTLGKDADDTAWVLNLDIDDFLIPDLTFALQAFNHGEDYLSVQAARREQDVLLTEGWMGTWQWTRPDYNFGNRAFRDAIGGVGYAGWSGEAQQVVSLMADNAFTDFDETVAMSVTGWKGFTIVPRYTIADIELQAEYTYVDYNQNWQACGSGAQGYAAGCGSDYPRNEGTNSWGLGGWTRSVYSPYQDRETEIYGFRANYIWDIGNGIDLEFKYRFIEDDDDRVTKQAFLTDAYDGYPQAPVNPDWIPNVGLGGCVKCDDREAEYSQLGFSFGYQLHPDLYGKINVGRYEVDLVDGTIDVAPVALGFEGSPATGYVEYLTGEHTKDMIGVELNYFLSGVEFGAIAEWWTGDYDPEFYVDNNGRRSRLRPAGDFVTTPLGNISTDDYDYDQYRLKAFMKVSF